MVRPDPQMSRATDTIAYKCSYAFATWFGVGLTPKAPGTAGTLAALPLHWLLVAYGTPRIELVVLIAICCAGIVASQIVSKGEGNSDPQAIVVDEVAGVMIALLVAGGSISAQIVAIVAFRVVDILKPWPISRLEDLPYAGLAVMADDLMAGLIAALCVWGWMWLAI